MRNSWRAVGLSAIYILAGVLAGCDDASTELSRNFLLRRPSDNPSSSVVSTFSVQPGSTDVIGFEWEPAVGAEDYRLVLWPVDSKDSLNLMRGRFDRVAFEFDVSDPKLATVPYSASDTTDQRRIQVVQHDVPLSAIADHLDALGMPTDQDLFFLWSVFARRGEREVRSVELHRIIFRLLGSPETW